MANDGFIEFLTPDALAQLKQASEIVDKLVPQIEKISKFKAPKTPSGADNSAKQMEADLKAQEKAMEKARVGLQKLSDAQKQAVSKRNAEMNAEWDAYEKNKKKEKEASDKLLATEIANAEKIAKAEIDKNNKIIQAAEKRAERERQIEERKEAKILASQQRQLERQAKIDAKDSRTGASSVIPGMGAKIADLRNAEKEAIALEKAALSNQKLNDAYGKLNASRNQAARTLQNLIASETASNAEIRKAQREFDTLNNKVKKADQAVGNFSRNVGNYGSALSGVTQLMGAFGIATGLALGADIVRNIFQTTKELQSLDLALKMVSETQNRYASNTSFVRELSERWGIEIKGLTEQFTQFYVNAKGKLSEDAIRKSFEGIAKAGALMGISIDKQNDAFYAFNQMLSKGTVQAEELKKQLGNALPGAIKAATMAYQELNPNLKVTEQMMLDQMKAGKLVSTEMVPAIIRAYQKLYGIENVNGVDTLSAATNRLSNSWTELVRSLNESETGGISKFFNIVITGLDGILQGLRLINESDLQARERILKMLENNAYQQYYQGIKDLQNEDLENTKKYNSDKILENASLINKLTQQNKDYAKDATLGGAQRYELTQSNIKQIQELNNLTSRLKGENRAINDVLKERIKASTPKEAKPLTDEEIKARAKKAKALKKALDEENKLLYENRKKELELELQVINRSLNDKELYYSDRIIALDLAFKKENEILQLTYEYQRKLAGTNLEKQKEALLIFHSSTLKSIEDYNKKREELEKLELRPADVVKGKSTKDQLKEIAEAETREFEARVKALNATKKATEDAKKAMDDYALSFAQGFMADAGFSATFDMLSNNIEGFGKDAKITALAITESFQEMFNFIAEMSQRNFEAEKEQLEQQTQIALAFAGESDTARAEIERQAEQRRKEIQRREFKAKKEQAIFNIAIDTAQAIIGIWAQVPKVDFGISAGLLSAFVGALGLAQIAMVQSQQVPAFKDGGVHEGGAMLVNDGSGSNYKETIQTPDGKIYQPKERNVIMNAPKGTKIFTHDQWQKNLDNILMKNEINYSQPNVVVNSGITNEQMDRLASIVENIPQPILSIDKQGWNTNIRNGHTQKEILNNQVTFGR